MLYQRGKAYSQDLRERVFAASDDGERVGEVAELLRVSVSYVSKALTRRRTTGETMVRPGRGGKPPGDGTGVAHGPRQFQGGVDGGQHVRRDRHDLGRRAVVDGQPG